MRRWGLVVSIFYAIVVIGLLWPSLLLLLVDKDFIATFINSYRYLANPNEFWPVYVWALLLVGGQILLLFLAVDTSWRPRRPRIHLALAITLSTFLFTLLCFAAYMSVIEAGFYDSAVDYLPASLTGFIAWWLGLWVLWAGVFYAYYRDSSVYIDKAVSWLLKGSILELLIAVSAHVVARQRDECTHPLATSFGIVTGLAIMLMCFGPGVLALHKKRIAGYRKPNTNVMVDGNILEAIKREISSHKIFLTLLVVVLACIGSFRWYIYYSRESVNLYVDKIEGIVTNMIGEPLEGVSVYFSWQAKSNFDFNTGKQELASFSTLTDKNGNYVIEPLIFSDMRRGYRIRIDQPSTFFNCQVVKPRKKSFSKRVHPVHQKGIQEVYPPGKIYIKWPEDSFPVKIKIYDTGRCRPSEKHLNAITNKWRVYK